MDPQFVDVFLCTMNREIQSQNSTTDVDTDISRLDLKKKGGGGEKWSPKIRLHVLCSLSFVYAVGIGAETTLIHSRLS